MGTRKLAPESAEVPTCAERPSPDVSASQLPCKGMQEGMQEQGRPQRTGLGSEGGDQNSGASCDLVPVAGRMEEQRRILRSGFSKGCNSVRTRAHPTTWLMIPQDDQTGRPKPRRGGGGLAIIGSSEGRQEQGPEEKQKRETRHQGDPEKDTRARAPGFGPCRRRGRQEGDAPHDPVSVQKRECGQERGGCAHAFLASK